MYSWLSCYEVADLPGLAPLLEAEITRPCLHSQNHHCPLELLGNIKQSVGFQLSPQRSTKQRDDQLLCKNQPTVVPALAKLNLGLDRIWILEIK